MQLCSVTLSQFSRGREGSASHLSLEKQLLNRGRNQGTCLHTQISSCALSPWSLSPFPTKVRPTEELQMPWSMLCISLQGRMGYANGMVGQSGQNPTHQQCQLVGFSISSLLLNTTPYFPDKCTALCRSLSGTFLSFSWPGEEQGTGVS